MNELANESRKPHDFKGLLIGVRAALEASDYPKLQSLVRNSPAPALALVIRSFPTAKQVVVFRILPRELAASAFEFLTVDEQRDLLRAMGKEEIAKILNDMAPDDRTSLFEELPASVTKQLLFLLSPEERATAIKLLGYPEGSVGRLMTPNYIEIKATLTVQQVLDYVREHGGDSETLNVLYVVDEQGRILDDIRIRDFLLAPVTRLVSDLMDYRYVCLRAADSQERAVQIFKDEDRKALPVVDSGGFLLGIVTIDDVLSVAETAATKDIQRIGGTESLDEPYMQIALTTMVKKRAGWLVVLFLGELLTATAMGFFEGEIAKAVVLALFVPLIISSGGNSGSQATTLIIRALALGEVTLRDWTRVLRREIITGLLLGLVLGSIGFLRIGIWSAFSTIYGPHWLLVACTVGVSLVGIVMWGSIAGSMLPFVLRKVGFDPATASAPFVATLVDVTGLIIYFSVALTFLKGTLL
ncbi:magnesium transporter [soil metagenome]